MIAAATLTLVTALLLAPAQDAQDTPHTRARTLSPVEAPVEAGVKPERQIRILDVSDLTGANRLVALREAIENDLLDQEVRVAALERYLDIVESGEMEARAQGLADAIETFCDPQDEDMRIAIPGPGEMIVAADARAQRWIDGFLAGSRAFDGFIDFEVVIHEVAKGTAADVWNGRTGVLLDAPGTADLLKRLEADPKASRLSAPRVVTYPGAPASIFAGEQTAYVKDFEFTVLPGRDVEVADPVIDVVQTGTSIDLLAIPLERERLAVHVEFSQSVADMPFPEFTTTLGRNMTPVTVQLPEVRVAKVETRFELDPGASIALSVKDPSDETRDIVVVMRAKRVDPERLEDPFGEDPTGSERGR